jgi:ATP-dependent Clp protease ATP-binding subunit ClpA
MFERFTDRARKVLALANQEAQRLRHEYIGTEHILLGLIEEGNGVGASVLRNLDVAFERIHKEVERLVRPGEVTAAVAKLPMTPRAHRALELAIEEARTLNHQNVGTEHLLLGLMQEQDGIAAQVLRNLGLKPEQVREETLLQLACEPDAGPNAGPPRGSDVIGGLSARSRNAKRALDTLVAVVEVVRKDVLEALKAPAEPAGPNVSETRIVTGLPVTPRLRRIVELACEEAAALKHDYLGTEHVLLGLLRDKDGVAAQIFRSLDVRPERVRDEVMKLF